MNQDEYRDKSMNIDPLSGAPGAHPVGTGVGALGGAVAGAAAGALGGPVGALAGGVVGAVAGGLGGKAAAESFNPTAEEAYWRDNYMNEPYYETGRSYDDYAPAYRLGLEAQTRYEDENFDVLQDRLADDWERTKERSTLHWSEAKAASRAAWNRVSTATPSYSDMMVGDIDNLPPTAASSEMASNDDVIDTLNDLLEACRDGEYGFAACADHTSSTDLRELLLRHAGECRTAGLELQTLIRQLGGEADEGGSVSGALHRGWVSVRGTLGGYSDQAMLDECERGEDSAVASYRKALRTNLPSAVRSVVERQAQGAQRNHDQVKAMRDALKAKG